MPSSGDRIALFLDFDGTLVEIAGSPDAIVVPPDLPDILRALGERLGGALAIVTGRSLADIDRFLPGLPIDGCGLHGLERRIDGRRTEPDLPDLSGEAEALRRRFADRPGVIVENKRIGVGLHWRLEPSAADEAQAAIADLAARLGPDYRVQDGKAVREVVPANAGKGAGIRFMMGAEPYSGRRPVFAGDDRTDEDGFEAVLALGGVAVKVGPGPTGASRRVSSPAACLAVLRSWSRTGVELSGLDVV